MSDAYAGVALFEYDGHRYGYSDVCDAIRSVGLTAGSTAFVHSDLAHFGKLADSRERSGFVGAFIDALIDAVSPGGNLIVPAFSYAFCRGEVFDPERTPSTVGILTEHFRKLQGVRRSEDAIFSVAALGPEQDYFVDVGTDCFGPQSIFEKLYERNAWLVFLGETFDITFIHLVEQRLGVPYRYKKQFMGVIQRGNRRFETAFDYNVRRLDQHIEYDLEGIARYLDETGVLRTRGLGHSKVRAVRSVDAFQALTDALRKDTYCLLKTPPPGIVRSS